MKYLNILAGAFSLMALAACTNDDEVTTVEQSKEVRTITVAYNQGADTRYEITLDDAYGDPPYYTYEYSKGFKVKWTSGDQIALIKDGTTYTFFLSLSISDTLQFFPAKAMSESTSGKKSTSPSVFWL